MTSLRRATAIMSGGTVLSRVTGLLRLAAIAAALGVTDVADAYNLANTAPNIIYELLLGGVLTSVFVPIFVELIEKEGREKAWAVASAIINVCLVALVAMAIVGVLAAPWITDLYTSRLEGSSVLAQERALTLLLRLFIPQIVFYGLTAMTSGLLNAHKRFGAPMYTPVLNNLAVIAVFATFHLAYGAVSIESVTTPQLLLIGLGTTAGVALMALAQLPFLRGLGTYRGTFSVNHPSVRKLLKLSTFVIGYVVVNQIGYLIVQWLAYRETGAYSAYSYAFIFFMLPHGLVAVSIITALLPSMSEHATHARWDAFRERLSMGIRATALLVLPAAVGYLVLAEPIVGLLENGVMTDASTELVASVLRVFVLGLVSFSTFQLFLRAFYALHDTKTPFLINCGAVALNTAANIPLFLALGVRGLAAGHALAYTFGASLQARALSRRLGGLEGRRVASSLARIAAAAAGMALVVLGVQRLLGGLADSPDLLRQAAAVALLVTVGAATYLGLALVLKVPEIAFVSAAITRRFPRRSAQVPPETADKADMQIRRDESGVVLDWLAKILLVLGIFGVVLFDAGSVAVNYLGLDSTADDIAAAVSTDIVNAGDQMGPREIEIAAQQMATEAGAKLVRADVNPKGVLHIKLRRSALTLIVRRVDALKPYGRATATAKAGTG